MVVAPAYIISEKIDGLTFGRAEYMVQGMVFCVFCIIKKKIKPVYFFSFFTGVLYGILIDFWRSLWGKYMTIIIQSGKLVLGGRILYFIIGVICSAFSVSLFYRIYLYSPVYEFFVKGVSKEFGIDVIKFKRAFDASGLIIACILSAVLFQKLIGVGIGTFIMAYFNGIIIDHIGKMQRKNLNYKRRIPKGLSFKIFIPNSMAVLGILHIFLLHSYKHQCFPVMSEPEHHIQEQS